MRLKHKSVLIVVINRCYSDRYVSRSVRQGYIIIPQAKTQVDDQTLFLFDDVTALGIAYPTALVEILQEYNQPLRILRAEELAQNLAPLLPPRKDVVALSGGGILTYLFLRQAGYQGELCAIAEVERIYSQGIPLCQLKGPLPCAPRFLMDDIIASGKTLDTVLKSSQSNTVDIACLVASTNVPKGNDGERMRDRSTFVGVQRLYCSQLVNGLLGQDKSNRKPAILSLRYLLTKAVDNGNYREGYLAKKFGGYQRAEQIASLVRMVIRQPIDLLRTNPKQFLAEYLGNNGGI